MEYDPENVVQMTKTLRDNHSVVNNNTNYTGDDGNRGHGHRVINDLTTLLTYEIDPQKYETRQKELTNAIVNLKKNTMFNKNFLSNPRNMKKWHFKNLAKRQFPPKQIATMTEPIVMEQKSTSTAQLEPQARRLTEQQQQRTRRQEQDKRLIMKQKEEKENLRKINLLSHLNGQGIFKVSEDMIDAILSSRTLYDNVMAFQKDMTMEQYNDRLRRKVPTQLDKKFTDKIRYETGIKKREKKKIILNAFLEKLGIRATNNDVDTVVADGNDYLYDQIRLFNKDTTTEAELDQDIPESIRNGLITIIQEREKDKKKKEQERIRKEQKARALRQKEQAQRIMKRKEDERLKELEERKTKLVNKLNKLKMTIPSNLDVLVADDAVYDFLMNFDKETTELAQLNRHNTKLERETFLRMKEAIEERMDRDKIAIELDTLDKYAKRLKKYGYPKDQFDIKTYVEWINKNVLNKTHFGSMDSFKRDAPMLIDHGFLPLNILDVLKSSSTPFVKIETYKNSYTNSINKRLSGFATEVLETVKRGQEPSPINMKTIRDLWSKTPVV